MVLFGFECALKTLSPEYNQRIRNKRMEGRGDGLQDKKEPWLNTHQRAWFSQGCVVWPRPRSSWDGWSLKIWCSHLRCREILSYAENSERGGCSRWSSWCWDGGPLLGRPHDRAVAGGGLTRPVWSWGAFAQSPQLHTLPTPAGGPQLHALHCLSPRNMGQVFQAHSNPS